MASVNINPAYRRAELEYALNKVECKALVLAPALKTSDYLAIVNGLAPELATATPGDLQAKALPALRAVVRLGTARTPGMLRFEEVAAGGGAAERARIAKLACTLQFDDPINIQFTSGTTGFPKGAFDPLSVLEAVQAERCTALYGVPTMFIAELDHPHFAEFDLSTLRTGIMAGSPCPVEVMKRVQAQMNMRQATIAYGMTETSPVSTQSSVDDPLERRVSTVGRVQPHIEVKIVDPQGRIVPRGVTGEFCTRGYWNDDAKIGEAIDAGGWMHTGDLATMDDEGYVNIVGRLNKIPRHVRFVDGFPMTITGKVQEVRDAPRNHRGAGAGGA
jgi:fatty-acyl-CoA synthase